MSLINTQNVKRLAKEYGSEHHGKNLQVSADFVRQIEALVEAVVKTNVIKQDNLAGTLRPSQWGEDRLSQAKELI